MKTSNIFCFFLVGVFTVCNRFSCVRISCGSPQIIRFLLGLSVCRCFNNSTWQFCGSGGWWIPAIFPDWAEQESGKTIIVSFISVLIMIVSVWDWNPPLLKSSSVISCYADDHAGLKSLGKGFVQRHVWSVNVNLQSVLTLNLSRMWETIFLGHRQLKPGLGRASRNFLTTFHELDRQTPTRLRLPMQFMRNSVGTLSCSFIDNPIDDMFTG